MGITQKEFARRMGVSPQAVNKRVRAGRLSRLPDGTLDPVVAEQEWNATKEPSAGVSVPPASPGSQAVPFQRPSARPPALASAAQGPATSSAPAGTYAQAKTADALYKARLRQLEYEAKSGTYVRAEEVANRWFEHARAIRDRMLAIPDRLAAELAAQTSIHEVRRRLDEEIRIALQELADEVAAGSVRSDGGAA